MRKIICDACKAEGASNVFVYLCHLDFKNPIDGYVDGHGNAISGRTVTVDLCNKCYNSIVGKAVVALKKAQAMNA